MTEILRTNPLWQDMRDMGVHPYDIEYCLNRCMLLDPDNTSETLVTVVLAVLSPVSRAGDPGRAVHVVWVPDPEHGRWVPDHVRKLHAPR